MVCELPNIFYFWIWDQILVTFLPITSSLETLVLHLYLDTKLLQINHFPETLKIPDSN